MSESRIDRRDFLKGAAATAMAFLLADELVAAENEVEAVSGPPVKIGVIGLGQWGKEIVSTLSRLPSAEITAICDKYEPFVTKMKESVPSATAETVYQKLLESPNVEAVIIATPSHLHKQIVLEAIQAGKHVYCEAPLATTIEDAKAIAIAGKSSKQVFQAGLQGRSNLLYKHVLSFVKAGALGNAAQVFAQAHKRDSLRRMAPTPEREKEINWRLSKETSPGLVGEVGIHHLDLTCWYLDGLPTAVIGFSGIIAWDDGRDVPDTIQCVFEYPKGIRAIFSSTLASSFSSAYTLLQGSCSSLLMREERGWMIKEADSPLLGWEVYAKKEQCFEETGICMIADATKIMQAGKKPGEEGDLAPSKPALYCALENFTRSIREGLAPSCGAVEGYQSTVVVLKANEAVLSQSKLTYEAGCLDLA